jgi:hypothetical protein
MLSSGPMPVHPCSHAVPHGRGAEALSTVRQAASEERPPRQQTQGKCETVSFSGRPRAQLTASPLNSLPPTFPPCRSASTLTLETMPCPRQARLPSNPWAPPFPIPRRFRTRAPSPLLPHPMPCPLALPRAPLVPSPMEMATTPLAREEHLREE